VQTHRVNRPGKCLDHLGDESVAVGDFDSHMSVHDGAAQPEPLFNLGRERTGVGGFEDDDVAADARTKFGRSAFGDDFALMQ